MRVQDEEEAKWGVSYVHGVILERSTTPNIVFSVTDYLELQNCKSFFSYKYNFYSGKMLIFHNVQTTHLTHVGKKWENIINIYNIMQSQIVSDTKCNI
jgi:hypothetical protein